MLQHRHIPLETRLALSVCLAQAAKKTLCLSKESLEDSLPMGKSSCKLCSVLIFFFFFGGGGGVAFIRFPVVVGMHG